MRLSVFNKNFLSIYDTSHGFEATIRVASRAAGEVTATLTSRVTSEVLYLRDSLDTSEPLVLFVEVAGRRSGGLIHDVSIAYDDDVITMTFTAYDPLGSVLDGVVTVPDPGRDRNDSRRITATMDAAVGAVSYLGHQILYNHGVKTSDKTWHSHWNQGDVDRMTGTPVRIAVPEVSQGYLSREIAVPQGVEEGGTSLQALMDQVPELSFIGEIILPEDEREELPGGGFLIRPIVKASKREVIVDYDGMSVALIEDAITALVEGLEAEAGYVTQDAIPREAIVYADTSQYSLTENVSMRKASKMIYGGQSRATDEDDSPQWGEVNLTGVDGYLKPGTLLSQSGSVEWTPRVKAEILSMAPSLAGSRDVTVTVTDTAPWRPLLDFHCGEEVFFRVPHSQGLFYSTTLTGVDVTLSSDDPANFTLTCEKSPFTSMAQMILDAVAAREARIKAAEEQE